MRNVRLNYAVVGAFVLAMLVALGVIVAMLTGRTGNTDTFYAQFGNVGGLKYGTKVTYEGYVIGQVEEITPNTKDAHTVFRVRLSVRQGWAMPKDSVARISAAGLLAAVVIDIKGGTEKVTLAPDSDITSVDGGNLFAVMSDVAGQLGELSRNGLEPMVRELNRQVAAIGANLQTITGDIATQMPAITGDVRRMTGTLSRDVINETNARKLAESLDGAARLIANLEDSRRKLDSAMTALDHVVTTNQGTVDASLKDLRYTLQTVARSIDAVTYNLEGTTRNFNEFSRQIRDNPGLLLSGRPTEDGPRGK